MKHECARCGRISRDRGNWNCECNAGRVVAVICPACQSAAENTTHDYLRHGTTSLFAALEVATGTVTDACYQRHTHAEFLDGLKLVAKAYPRVKLHVVADNYATHVCPESEVMEM